jgi:hypothetical protein
MRATSGAVVALLAFALAACSPPTEPPPTSRDSDDARKSLPDAYKHPPK